MAKASRAYVDPAQTCYGEFVIRAPLGDELRLVRDSWTKGVTRGDKVRIGGHKLVKFGPDRGLDSKTLGAAHRLWVDHQLKADGVVVVVGALGQLPDEALGWACYDITGAVHWVWVRSQVRRKGLGRALLEHSLAQLDAARFTHITPDGLKLLEAVRWRR